MHQIDALAASGILCILFGQQAIKVGIIGKLMISADPPGQHVQCFHHRHGFDRYALVNTWLLFDFLSLILSSGCCLVAYFQVVWCSCSLDVVAAF